MDKPLVSVLMPVFNAAHYLHESIESILSQTLVEFEFIIIDDGSSDDSRNIIKKYSNIDKRIKYFKQNNSGISFTRNRLLSLANSEIIAWMDADDISSPTRLEKQYDFLKQNTEYVAIGTSTIMIDMDGDEIFEWNAPLEHKAIDELHLDGKAGAIIFPSSMMRKSITRSIGGFDENLTGAEDLCLFLRFAEVGRLANLKEHLFYYRQHVESICHSSRNQINTNRFTVLKACKSRRGINETLQADFELSENQKSEDIYLKWAWWAIKGKRFNTAQKYGLKVLKNNFFCKQAWLIFFISVLRRNIS